MQASLRSSRAADGCTGVLRMARSTHLRHLAQCVEGMVVSIVHTLDVRVCHDNVWQELKVHKSPGKALWELQQQLC